MAFDTEELRAEVEAEFEETQFRFDLQANIDAVYGAPLDAGKGRVNRLFSNNGFIIRGKLSQKSPVTPQRKAYLRSYERAHAAKDIRARILAGERPNMSGRGRPPTRWFAIAAELGIDLRAPVTPPSPSSAAGAA